MQTKQQQQQQQRRLLKKHPCFRVVYCKDDSSDDEVNGRHSQKRHVFLLFRSC